MTPTEFEFTVTLPRDSRMMSTLRQLALQAAGYATMSPAAGEALAAEVERATNSALAGICAPDGRIHVRFAAEADALDVVMTCDAGAAIPSPSSSTHDQVSVDWRTEGMRHTCHIRQRMSAS